MRLADFRRIGSSRSVSKTYCFEYTKILSRLLLGLKCLLWLLECLLCLWGGWLWLELRLLGRLWLLLSGLLCISLVDFVFYLVKQAEGLTGFTTGLKSIETRIETLLRLS